MDTQCSRRENQAIIRLTRGVFSIDLLPLLPTIKTSVPQINILSHNSKSLKHTITKTVGQSALNHPPLEIKISKEINAKDGKWQDEGPRCRWYRNGDRISTYCFPLCSRFPIYNSSSLKAVIILLSSRKRDISQTVSREVPSLWSNPLSKIYESEFNPNKSTSFHFRGFIPFVGGTVYTFPRNVIILAFSPHKRPLWRKPSFRLSVI